MDGTVFMLLFNFIRLELDTCCPSFVKTLECMCHGNKDVFISVVWAEKQLSISKNKLPFGSGRPVELEGNVYWSTGSFSGLGPLDQCEFQAMVCILTHFCTYSYTHPHKGCGVLVFAVLVCMT